jgi:creatinine amidohydrolase/Fe(II)-dependent formamide hydrolase-like protein
MSTLSTTLQNTEKELDAKSSLVAEAWKKQDEEARQKRQLRTQQIKSDLESETFTKLQAEIMQRMQRLQLARDAKVMEVERSRAVRLAREQADEAVEVAERAQILKQKAELANAAEATAKIAEEGLSAAQKHLLEVIYKLVLLAYIFIVSFLLLLSDGGDGALRRREIDCSGAPAH